MKLAVLQLAPALADLEATLARLEPLLERARGADLVVLPELCNSGYALSSREQARSLAEEIAGGPFLDFLQAAAREGGQHIVAGFAERDGTQLYNSAVLMGPAGARGHYRKTHLFFNEPDLFEPGDLGLPVFELGELRVGMLICFDWCFPEVWRALALAGADLICHPSNLVIPGRCQRAVPVHAMINRIYAATANRIGAEGELRFTGGSLIADPDGEVLAAAPPAEAACLVADIDVARARDKLFTPRNHALRDRRPALYGRLVEEDS